VTSPVVAYATALPYKLHMSKAFDKLAAGLADAIAFAEGDTSKGRVAAGPDVKAIRAKTKLSQAKFAEKLRVPIA